MSNIACSKNEIKLLDFVFPSTDAETRKIIVNLFQITKNPKFTCAKIQWLIGTNNCGLFAIAVDTCIAFGLNPVCTLSTKSNEAPFIRLFSRRTNDSISDYILKICYVTTIHVV